MKCIKHQCANAATGDYQIRRKHIPLYSQDITVCPKPLLKKTKTKKPHLFLNILDFICIKWLRPMNLLKGNLSLIYFFRQGGTRKITTNDDCENEATFRVYVL